VAVNQEHLDSSLAVNRSLQTCDVLTDDFKAEPFTIVIFGGAGDLTKRMLLPTPYNLHRDGRLPKDFSVVGLGLPELSDEAYRRFARAAINQFATLFFLIDQVAASLLSGTGG
jgi:glucose-6-phosphate 1-dehydrogenase